MPDTIKITMEDHNSFDHQLAIARLQGRSHVWIKTNSSLGASEFGFPIEKHVVTKLQPGEDFHKRLASVKVQVFVEGLREYINIMGVDFTYASFHTEMASFILIAGEPTNPFLMVSSSPLSRHSNNLFVSSVWYKQRFIEVGQALHELYRDSRDFRRSSVS